MREGVKHVWLKDARSNAFAPRAMSAASGREAAVYRSSKAGGRLGEDVQRRGAPRLTPPSCGKSGLPVSRPTTKIIDPRLAADLRDVDAAYFGRGPLRHACLRIDARRALVRKVKRFRGMCGMLAGDAAPRCGTFAPCGQGRPPCLHEWHPSTPRKRRSHVPDVAHPLESQGRAHVDDMQLGARRLGAD